MYRLIIGFSLIAEDMRTQTTCKSNYVFLCNEINGNFLFRTKLTTLGSMQGIVTEVRLNLYGLKTFRFRDVLNALPYYALFFCRM